MATVPQFAISARTLAALIVNLAGPKPSPVADAAARHERAIARTILGAIAAAQDAVPMNDLTEMLQLGHSGTGGPLYIVDDALRKIETALLDSSAVTRTHQHTTFVRTLAATLPTLTSALGDTLADGAAAGEVCVPIAHPIESELAAARKLGLPQSYSGIDSKPALRTYSVDNPLPRAKHTTFNDVQRIPANIIGQAGTPREFKIHDLLSPQDYIQPTAVDYIQQGVYFKTRPLVATINGEDVILNGNHAVLAAKLSGQKTIEVTYIGVIQ